MMIPENGQGNEHSSIARGLGPLFSGLIAATLITLTLLVAVALGMGEQEMLARLEPTATETEAPSVLMPSPSLSPSPTLTFTPIPPSLAASSTPSSSPSPVATASATLTPRPTRTPRPTGVYPTATRCIENPWGWDSKWTVRSGDTLYSIAQATGTNVSDLMEANCLTSDLIYSGTALWVPHLPVTPTRVLTRTPSVPAPEIISFTLDPANQVLLGERVQLDWAIEGDVDEITLTAGTDTLVSDGENSGSVSDYPSELGSRSYLLEVVGPGGSDSASRSLLVVDELVPPVAGFSASPTSGEVPLTVSFNDESTGEINEREWDFGDGDTSTQQNPSHTYKSAGTFDVSLTVTGPDGSGTLTRAEYISVTVPPPPEADFSATPTSGQAPLTVNFTDLSTGEITDWEWDFGDNETSTEKNPSHPYENAGEYSVSLTVTGPGGSDTEKKSKYIQVTPPPPEADFSASLDSEDPLTVNFTDLSTGEITDWEWDFGDEETSKEKSPSHPYENAGNYSVSLTVTGPGGSDTTPATVQVGPAPEAAESRRIVSLAIVAPNSGVLTRAQDQPLPT